MIAGSRFLRREPAQARSRALVDAVLVAFEQMARTFTNERDITIERIVDRAGVGIGSFYEYFTNKDSLLGVLVESATRDNFDALLDAVDTGDHADLDAAIAALAHAVVVTYLAHPVRTRMLISGIGRLGLMRVVVAERDRFAEQIAHRAARYLPHASPAALTATMVLGCDAVMGIVGAALYRAPRAPDDIAAELARVVGAVIRSRHS